MKVLWRFLLVAGAVGQLNYVWGWWDGATPAWFWQIIITTTVLFALLTHLIDEESGDELLEKSREK